MQPDGAEGNDRAVALVTRYIGLDLHKDYIHGCEWLPHEAREKHFRLKNNRDAWANLAKMLRLLQYRFKLVQDQVRCKNQVKAILRRYDCGSSRVNNAASILRALDHLNLDAADAAMLVSAARLLASLETERESVEVEIARRIEKHPEAKALLSIPGVGILTAAAIWAWIGEPGRFRTSKQVASYAGLDPSVHQSGQTYYHGKVSKNGNRLLRTVLIEAAQVVARHDRGTLGQFYRRKSLHIGSRKAIVALARKLIVVAWKILSTGETYRDEVVDKTRRKEIRFTE